MSKARANDLELADDVTHHSYAHGWVDSYLYSHGVEGEPSERQLCDAVHALERYLHARHPNRSSGA